MIKRIKFPDGSIKRVKMPDDWTDEQIQQARNNYFKSQEETESPQEKSSTDMEMFKSLLKNSPSLMPASDTGKTIGRDLLIGLMNLGKEAYNVPHNLASFVAGEGNANKIFSKDEKDYSKLLDQAMGRKSEGDTTFDSVIQNIPTALPFFAEAPAALFSKASKYASEIPKFGEYLSAAFKSKPVQEGITQGALTSALSPQDQGSKGLEASALAMPASKLGDALKLANPLFRSLGRYATLGLGAKGASLFPHGSELAAVAEGVSPSGLSQFMMPSTELEEGIRKGMFENIFPLSRNPEVTQLYNKSFYRGEVPSKITPSFKSESVIKVPPHIFGLGNNEIFKEAEKKMLQESTSKEFLKGVPRNSIQYLDEVKKAISEIEAKAIREGATKTRLGRLKEARNLITDKVANFSKNYEGARKLASKQISRANLESAEDLSKYLKDEDHVKSISRALKENPQTQQQFLKFAETFKDLNKIRPVEGKSFFNIKNLKNAYAYDTALMNLAKDPVFANQFAELLKPNLAEKLVGKGAKNFYPLSSYGLSR